jgi:hypothetical protein
MSNPILKKFKSDKAGGEEQRLPMILADLAVNGIRAVTEDMDRQARYGQISNAPISVDFSDVRLQDQKLGYRVVVVTAVVPTAMKAEIAENVRAAIADVFTKGDDDSAGYSFCGVGRK